MSVGVKQSIWRQSASLILIANSINYEKLKKHVENIVEGNAENNMSTKESFDYNLLLLIRSDNTAIVTNQCVFPGGIFETADESLHWLKYFMEFGVTETALRKLIIASGERPAILAQQGTGCYERFFSKNKIWAREVSLRITALRETFEEVGILLCRTRDQLGEIIDGTENTRNRSIIKGYSNSKDNFDKKHWQQIVHNDPSEFLHLCQVLDVVPDLWSLYEWSAWASPAAMIKGDETVFFITFLREKLTLQVDPIEVKECMWRTPKYFLSMFRESNIWFLPPQLYELSRLKTINTFKVLFEFTKERQTKNITLYMGIEYVCTDGIVSVLPGDDVYSKNPRNVKDFITIDKTIEQFRAEAKKYHRVEYVGLSNMRIQLNFQPLNGHLSPAKIWFENYKL